LKIIALISMFLLLTLPHSSFTALGDAVKPQWNVGNTWVYNTTFFNKNRTIEVEVTEISTVNVNDTNYDVYVVKTLSNITIQNVDYSTVVNSYVLRSNLAKVKTEFTETAAQDISITMITTYSPPRRDYNFPLKVGKTWQSTFTESLFDGENYNNLSRRLNYSVIEKEDLTLEAGTFESYKIKVDDDFGSTYYDWYSPEVNNTVNSTLGSDMFLPIELISSTLIAQEDGDTKPDDKPKPTEDFPYLLLLIPVIMAVILVVILVLKKKGSKKKKKKKKKKGGKKKKKKSAKGKKKKK
jgi:hypothetical protein